MRGTVKWFNDEKGFGFIRQGDGGKDCFVHYSDIEGMQGRRRLAEGDAVEFEVEPGERGLRARHVVQVAGGAATAP